MFFCLVMCTAGHWLAAAQLRAAAKHRLFSHPSDFSSQTTVDTSRKLLIRQLRHVTMQRLRWQGQQRWCFLHDMRWLWPSLIAQFQGRLPSKNLRLHLIASFLTLYCGRSNLVVLKSNIHLLFPRDRTLFHQKQIPFSRTSS